MNAIATKALYRTASFILPTATVYVEPLSHGLQVRDREKILLKEPVSAETVQKKEFFSDSEMACWIEGKIKNPSSPFPDIHILDSWQDDAAGFPVAKAHVPLTKSPHIVYRYGKQRLDFSHIIFEHEAVDSFSAYRRKQTNNSNEYFEILNDAILYIRKELAHPIQNLREQDISSAQKKKLDAVIQDMDNITIKRKTAVLASFMPVLQHALMGLRSRYPLTESKPAKLTRDDFRDYLMEFREKENSVQLDYDTADMLTALIPEELLFLGRPPKNYTRLCPPKGKKQ